MINPRTYYRPRTVDEAVKYLNEPNSIAISGGNRLLGGMTLPYEMIVDLQDLSDFKKIVYDDEGLHIGGSATLQDVIKSDYVLPHVKKAIIRTLPENQRNGISVGESLTISDPPREWLATLVVLGAEVEHSGFRKGKITAQESRLALIDFIGKLRGYGFPYAGFVTAIHIPVLYERAYLGTAHVSRTPSGIPIVNAAALVQIADDATITSIQVAAGGVSELPVLSLSMDGLIGKPFNETTITAAAESVRSGVKPVADYQGSVVYRREMAVVTVRRALLDCLAQLNT